MIERFLQGRKKETLHYAADAPLTTLRDVRVDPETIPQPLQAVFDWLNASQGPNFGDFGRDPHVNDVILEDADTGEPVYLAARILPEDNTVDGVAADLDSRAARFFSDSYGTEAMMEVVLLSDGRETAHALNRRLAAIKEFSQKRCFLSAYSSPNPTGGALQVWEELETLGKAKLRVMPNGQTRYLLL